MSNGKLRPGKRTKWWARSRPNTQHRRRMTRTYVRIPVLPRNMKWCWLYADEIEDRPQHLVG